MLQIIVCFYLIKFFLILFFLDNNSSICLTRDVLNSHLYGARRSTDGKYYIFAVQVAKIDISNDFISLSNDEIGLTLPTYLIVYQQRQ